jgi:hypothetical protein
MVVKRSEKLYFRTVRKLGGGQFIFLDEPEKLIKEKFE